MKHIQRPSYNNLQILLHINLQLVSETHPFKIHSFTPIIQRNIVSIFTNIGVNTCENNWIKICILTFVTALKSSSSFIDSPLTRKMSETAPYLTVTSGFSGPEIWKKVELRLKAMTWGKFQEHILRLFNGIIN